MKTRERRSMNELIKVNTDNMTVSGRDLYESLEIKERFSAWAERQRSTFEEEITTVGIPTEVMNNGGIQIREMEDFIVSVDIAKHICLMSRTEKGKKCRQYLIDLEKAWNTPELVMARGLKAAQAMIEQKDEQIKLLTADNKRMKPKEVFADAVTASDSAILIRDLAKLIKQNGHDIGEKRLYKWMREHGYIIKHSTQPTQKAMELGLFEVIERTIQRADMSPQVTSTTKVTGKGQQYFINKFLGGQA